MIARDRRLADRRHQDDEVGGQGRSVRLLVAGHRRHPRLPDRQRLAAEGVRPRDRPRAVAAAARHRAEGAARAGRRQALRRHRKRQVLHRPAARRRGGGAERGGAADEHEQRAAGRRARPSRCSAGAAISRGRVFFVSSDAVYAIGPKAAKALTGLRRRRAGGRRARARRRFVQVVADRAGAEARADREAAREAVRREGPLPARGDRRTWSLAGAEGHGRPTARSPSPPIRSSRPGTIKATVGDADRRGARARRAAAAVDRNVRRVRRRRRAARLDQRRRPASSRWRRSTARRCCRRRRTNTIFKRVRAFIGPDGLVELHLRGRRARHDAAAADGRHRHHRAALLAGALRQRAAAEARAVGAGDRSGRSRCRSRGRPTPGIT